MIEVSLQNYTTYSILSGTKQIPDWVKRASELGYKALAITDKQNLIGAFEFQKECLKHGINPIIGEEFILLRDVTEKEQGQGVVLIYAKDKIGYDNLVKLNNTGARRTCAYTPDECEEDPELSKVGFYFRSQIDYSMLERFSEGLVCVAPSQHSIGAVRVGNKFEFDPASKILFQRLSNIFEDDFYIGINPRLDGEDQEGWGEINTQMRSLPYKKVYTFNCHYPLEDQDYLYPLVRKLNGKSPACSHRHVYKGHLPSELDEEKVPRAMRDKIYQATSEILEKCQFRFETGNYKMPPVFLEHKEDLRSEIIYLLGEGFKRKLCPEFEGDLVDFEQLEPFADRYPFEHINKGEDPAELKPLRVYIDRLKYEFGVIEKTGFLNYFHTVDQFCEFVDGFGQHNRGIGRGSAAGALFSYLLHIVRVDPVRHGLYFERFLNEDRLEIPDIDLDFSSSVRDKLKLWMGDRYGQQSIASIGTASRLKVVSAIKDLARIYGNGIPDNDGNIVSYNEWTLKSIISNKHVSQTKRGREELDEYLEMYEDFKAFYDLHSNWIEREVMPLQETVTNLSIHASGTIVTPGHLDLNLPIREDSRGNIVTMFSHKDCEAIGYPKLDLLVVDAIDIISHAVDLIKRKCGVDVPEWEEIPLTDAKTLQIFYEDLVGIFQFNTYSFRKILKVIPPDGFPDCVILVAVNRPGPISANVPDILEEIKKGTRLPAYDLEALKPVLEETYGLIVYQEQMMEAAVVLSGFTGKEADHLRKATGKKSPEEMAKWEKRFIEGGTSNGHDALTMQAIWDKMVGFADYSFNKSHATSYTALPWYQAYIKARWPLEFYCAVLNYAKTDDKKDNSVTAVKKKAEARGVEFIMPTMEAFSTDFEPAGGSKIYWPMWALKGIGTKAIENLRDMRVNSFPSMRDMIETLDARLWKKSVYATLIKAGFFSSMGKPWEVMEKYYELRAEIKGKKSPEEVPFEYSHDDEFRWLLAKNEAYGTQIDSWKKLAPFSKGIQVYKTARFKQVEDNTTCFVGGMVTAIYFRQTKRGKWYAKMTLEDVDERYNVMLWSEYWDREILDKKGIRPQKGQLVEVIGKKTSFGEYPQLSVSEADDDVVRIVWRADQGE